MELIQKRIWILLLVMCTIIGIMPMTCFAKESSLSKRYNYDGFDIDYNVMNIWNEGYTVEIVITNTGNKTLENWSLLFDYNQEMSGIWNAVVLDNKNDKYVVSNNCYNHDIQVGESVTFGFRANGEVYYPQEFAYVSSAQYVEESDYKLSYNISNETNNQYVIDVSIENISDNIIEDWKLYFEYDCDIVKIWDAKTLISDNENKIIDNSQNHYIYPQQTVNFGMIITTDQDIQNIFAEKKLLQIERATCVDLELPYSSSIVDEVGNEYFIEWYTEESREPKIYQYKEISIDNILDLEERYSVSSLGVIYFEMPQLIDSAEVTTEFLEEPDLIVQVEPESQILKLIPFASEGNICTFCLDEDSIIIPVKYVEANTANITMLMAVEDNSNIKMFNILSNSNGSIEVELTALLREYANKSDMFSEDEYYVNIIDGTQTNKIEIGENMTFTYKSNNSGKITIEVYEDDILWDDQIWVQDVYLQKGLSLSVQQQEELLKKYAPIVVFESDEEYAPMLIEDIFAQIADTMSDEQMKFKTVFGKHEIDYENLMNFMPYNGHNKYLLDWNDALFNNSTSSNRSFENIKGDFSDSIIYTCVQEDENYYYLTYYFIYGYDKKVLIPGVNTWGIGCHNLDRESMTVVLDKNCEPLSIITGGHLDTTEIKYLDDDETKIFQWTGERVKTEYSQSISFFSQGHPLIYIEKGQHCIMPVAGDYNAGVVNTAGLVKNILNANGTFDSDKIKVIYPEIFSTEEDINRYTTKDLNIDEMYGSNILNFSGEWVDVLGTTNAKFPPFLLRDYNKTEWYASATIFDKNTVDLSNTTKRTQEQFENAYLFSLGKVENFKYLIEGNTVKLNWNEIEGADGYIITRNSNGSELESVVFELGNCSEYVDNTVTSGNIYSYSIKAFYNSDNSVYGEDGEITVFNNEAEITNVALEEQKGTIIVSVRDADTALELENVDVYLDDNFIGTTNGNKLIIDIASDTMHTITTKKSGYIDVVYKEVSVSSGEVLSLETLMQVPFSETYNTGGVSLVMKNALNGNNISGLKFVIREGMNTTTGDIYDIAISNSNGIIDLKELEPGNYTGIIENDNYVKTIFNFVVVGGKNKTYEVHVSPHLDDSEIRIILSWNENPKDLDSHLVSDSLHIYYMNRVEDGVQLDKDDRNGYGPETITLNTTQVSDDIYSYYVQRYADVGTIAESGAVVRVYKGDTLLKTYYADQTSSTSIWYVFKLDIINNQIIDY